MDFKKVIYYEGDKIQVAEGELLINGDFVDFADNDSEFWESLEAYYNIDQHIIALYSMGEPIRKRISLESLSQHIKDLVIECSQSQNEMLFIEDGDEKWGQLSAEELEQIQEEVKEKQLSSYIVFNENDALVTVFGGIGEVINFEQEKEF